MIPSIGRPGERSGAPGQPTGPPPSPARRTSLLSLTASSSLRAIAWLALLFVAILLTHWPLLRLPYYWDEAGYYIPAAYDFFRRGTLIPYSTLSNAHPPIPSLYLAAAWRLFGFAPVVTRSAMCLVAALALAAVYRLARQATGDRRAAAATLLLTALYPVWFAQSTLAHADLFAAAGTLWGLCLFLDRDRRGATSVRSLLPALCCFALAALAKEIAVGTPLALAVWEGTLGLRTRRLSPSQAHAAAPTPRAAHLETALLLTTPALPLAAWFAYHRWRTGFTFGNPEYLRYNATATLTPVRVLLALMHRALHLTSHLNLFVPVVITLGCLLLPRLDGARPMAAGTRARLLVVLVANWIFFSVLGGALLTRYLLPMYPLVLLLCVDAWRQRLRAWPALVALSGFAFVLGFLVNPPYRFAPEDTLAYSDSIRLQQDAIAEIQARYGRPTVLTAWPASDELTKPELGYVTQPLPVVAIDNFSYPQVKIALAKATLQVPDPLAQSLKDEGPAGPYSVALVFSTKYTASPLLEKLEGPLGARERAFDTRFFDFHQDLPAETIARLLGGTVVWQEQRHGQWAAVLHFDRPQLADLRPLNAP